MDDARLIAELGSAGVDLDTDPRRRAEYAYDASNYRVPPLGVAFPRSADEAATVVRECARLGIAITSRGGGTSMAGNAVGPGVVIDFSRFMNRVLAVDEIARTATVEPGVVLSDLQAHLAKVTDNTLTFAPDPSSKSRATVGGAIGNDACGNHSVRYGRTSDHVVEIDVVTIGQKASVFFRRIKVNMLASVTHLGDQPHVLRDDAGGHADVGRRRLIARRSVGDPG